MEQSQKLELERFISEHEASESSKKAYGTRYRRIIRGAGDYLPLKVPFHKASEEQLLDMIRLNVQDSKSPAELSVSLVSLAIMIRRLYKKPIGLLIDDRDDLNDKENFLYRPNKSSVQYIRNDYKTKSTYGTKNYVIKDKLFVKSFNALYDDGYDFLLSKKDKSQMSMGSVGAYVKKQTYPHESKSHGGVKSKGLTHTKQRNNYKPFKRI